MSQNFTPIWLKNRALAGTMNVCKLHRHCHQQMTLNNSIKKQLKKLALLPTYDWNKLTQTYVITENKPNYLTHCT
jgi:hypothetical protein